MTDSPTKTFSTKRTFGAAFLVSFCPLVMFLMNSVFHIDSYREDHFLSHEDENLDQHEIEDTSNISDNISSDSILVSFPEDTLNANDNIDTVSIAMDDTMEVVYDTPVITSETDYFEKLLADYKSTTLSQLPPNTSRTDLVVRYYRHEGDSDKVKSLADFGFYLHERPVDEDAKQDNSNALFYGDSVSSQDIKLIAYILMQNGLPICDIQPSKFHDSWKSKSVEIGVCNNAKKKSPLSKEDLIAFVNPFFEENLNK
jgi:hypothetical protein